MIWLLAAGLAQAQPSPPDAEGRYWEARLAESADGDVDGAIATYTQLAESPQVRDSPALRARILEALGRAHWSLGQYDNARVAFDGCRRIETSGMAAVDTSVCAELSRQVALAQGAVRRIPTTWTFNLDDPHGFVLFADRGTMLLERQGGRSALVWEQELGLGGTAELAVALDTPADTPTGVRLQLRSTLERTVLELVIVDVFGRTYVPNQRFVADPTQRTWDVAFADVVPRVPTWPALDPKKIAQVKLLAGSLSDERTSHRLLITQVTFY